jgi:hypothetical protein
MTEPDLNTVGAEELERRYETYIVCPNGYVWVASRILSMDERRTVSES